MKYNSNHKPLVCMMTTSTCYQNTHKMDVKGILWHSTGANNPTIKRYVQPSNNDPKRDELLKLIGKNQYGNDWNHIYIEIGLNCWVGKLADGTVTTVQTMPWDYRPWGCGSGNKGSCNDGWIQFEICEDNLKDRNYFEKIYKEACEITAYLCKMFNLDPYGKVNFKGMKVPVITCHAESHSYGLGSNHGDVLHWFKKYGKNMDDIRKDVASLMETPKPIEDEMYRVRKSWEQPNTQIGAYKDFENAKNACDKAGKEYHVYNNGGCQVYPNPAPTPIPNDELKIGDKIKIKPGSTYTTGEKIPTWVIDSTLYMRGWQGKNIIFSTLKTGAITGVTFPENVSKAEKQAPTPKPQPKPIPKPEPKPTPKDPELEIGDIIQLKKGAKFTTGERIPNWVMNSKLYMRGHQGKNIIFSTLKTGAITGVVEPKWVVGTTSAPADNTLHIGDKIKLKSGATYYDGMKIPFWVKTSTLYMRGYRGKDIIISTRKTGAITGVVAAKYVVKK